MIPADVVSQLQNSVSATRGASPQSPEVNDKLAGLVAGQKVVAEIQAVLPNGTYRAVIAQRNVTLALPFSAKAGDSLELLVTESDGKLALAVLSPPESDKSGTDSVSTTLSRTAQLINTLYTESRQSQDDTSALLLNENQPITSAPPENAEELAPLLKQAIKQSGMFYESHQANWVEGRLAKTELQHEPQGKLSSPTAFTPITPENSELLVNDLTTNSSEISPTTGKGASSPTGSMASGALQATSSNPASQTIAPQLQALVQQQLEALATQNFVWQGQVWPGQDLRWEIDENAAQDQPQDPMATHWSTSLRMTLPRLGAIDARIQLQGNQLTIAMNTSDVMTSELMRNAGGLLRSDLDAAGLTLTSMGFDRIPQDKDDGET